MMYDVCVRISEAGDEGELAHEGCTAGFLHNMLNKCVICWLQKAQAMHLDWDEPQGIRHVMAAVDGCVDLILAADCCYLDEVCQQTLCLTTVLLVDLQPLH